MESELTKRIKIALRTYKPILSNMRTIRWAEEVNVTTGYVDFIRFENYIKNENEVYLCGKNNNPISIERNNCNRKCEGCIYKCGNLDKAEYGIMTTCFEIKISKSDFKSKNGHNFVGNKNYYVVPKALYSEIGELVPNDIGIILFYENETLRLKKESAYKDISKENLNIYLFNALKKWCDLKRIQY
ncbi:hypothetical protein JJB71_17795 [Clostridium perfringens]|uniref:hypothetical protein n=1 Tax=Clostridium perfringens TaxID=1502 RepID=UPI001ABA34EE|nr:hypothetical protein [Clostridium perfringens]MBO3392290.1 hypothetical protein [Clostridium perfringens]MBO3399359.1 hypothetical protein [Clostridium perfringens]